MNCDSIVFLLSHVADYHHVVMYIFTQIFIDYQFITIFTQIYIDYQFITLQNAGGTVQ